MWIELLLAFGPAIIIAVAVVGVGYDISYTIYRYHMMMNDHNQEFSRWRERESARRDAILKRMNND